MTARSIRFLFDENFGKPLVEDIARLLLRAQPEEMAEVKHVLDFQQEIGLQRQGVRDEVWIPSIIEGNWIVVAGDLGRRGLKKGEKLPHLCVRHGITHFLLSPTVHDRKSFRKLLTVLSVWHEMISLTLNSPPGSRFFVEPSGPQPDACARGKITTRVVNITPLPPPGFLFSK